MPSIRKLLLDAIASLDAESSPERCTEALDKIFTPSLASDGKATAFDVERDGGVTPLMIACDKSIASALGYLRDQIEHYNANELSLISIFDAWGYVTEKSQESGNCAIHHAMAANFHTGVDVLEFAFSKTSTSLPEKSNNNVQKYMTLISQPNENGDTPIMMAAVYGHTDLLKHVLKRPYELVSSIRDVESQDIWKSLSELFDKRNADGCTALNLACGHGNVEIVRLLIHNHFLCERKDTTELKFSPNNDVCNSNDYSEIHELMPLVMVTYDDVRRCQSTIDNLEIGLKKMKHRRDEFQRQQKKALQCLDILNKELERVAAETAGLLLDQENTGEAHFPKRPKGKSSSKKKKKRQHTKQKHQEGCHVEPNSESTEGVDKSHNSWRIETEEKKGDTKLTPLAATSPFVTLQDGRVVSKSQKQDDIPCEDGSIDQVVHDNSEPKPLQSVLQSNSRYDDNAATTMESLCLDPSMLLLSAHRMAMELSPCQLDAIVYVLTKQFNASKEAQEIQSRLLRNNNK